MFCCCIFIPLVVCWILTVEEFRSDVQDTFVSNAGIDNPFEVYGHSSCHFAFFFLFFLGKHTVKLRNRPGVVYCFECFFFSRKLNRHFLYSPQGHFACYFIYLPITMYTDICKYSHIDIHKHTNIFTLASIHTCPVIYTYIYIYIII